MAFARQNWLIFPPTDSMFLIHTPPLFRRKTRVWNSRHHPSCRRYRRVHFHSAFSPGFCRYTYQTVPGRSGWPSRDPLREPGFNLFRRQTPKENTELNLYMYVDNSPLDYTDSLGLCTAYLCKRPVDFLWSPIAKRLPYHWFIKASFDSSEVSHCFCSCSGNGGFNLLSTQTTLEVGLGPVGENGDPGHNSPISPTSWFPETQPVDHYGESSQPGVTCQPITIKNCCGLLFSMLDKRPTGRRFPIYNCHSWVNDEIYNYGPPPPPPYSGGPVNSPTAF